MSLHPAHPVAGYQDGPADRYQRRAWLRFTAQQLAAENRADLVRLRNAAGDEAAAIDAIQERAERLSALNEHLLSELADMEEEVQAAHHAAHHDPLTGLPNRRLLTDRLQQAILQAERSHRQVAVIFVDLDDFKVINDTLGHQAGDRLLEQVGRRLSDCLRGSDTACRYGGDEFVLMLPDLDGPDRLPTIREKLLTRLGPPYRINGRNLTVSPTLGISLYPDDARDADALLEKADASMYRTKSREKGNGDGTKVVAIRYRPTGDGSR